LAILLAHVKLAWGEESMFLTVEQFARYPE
jgi:hypothetical protein